MFFSPYVRVFLKTSEKLVKDEGIFILTSGWAGLLPHLITVHSEPNN